MKRKVAVGMSGGVDSSVAAYLLKEQGYDVIGITMQTWQDEDMAAMAENEKCCGTSAVEDARRVADMLGIPYYVLDLKKEFKEHVIDYFVSAYGEARTPNPCIACNRYVKWGALLQKALELGCDYMATGHYAGIVKLENGRFALKKSASAGKDQTYALYNLTQDQLARTLMPVGKYDKAEIRKIAGQAGLPIADKPDSQEICFIPDDDYAGYIRRQSGKSFAEGNFIDLNGRVLGTHKGIIHYTIGQRKGLGLSLGRPAFVVDIKPDTNEVVIGTNEDTFHMELTAEKLNLMSLSSIDGELQLRAKIRYSHPGAACKVRMISDDTVHCVFQEPVRAITPGQAVVFYDGDIVVGGAVIHRWMA